MAKRRKQIQVPVSTRALVQRINRRLAGKWQRLKTTRGDRAQSELGDYYVIDTKHNSLVATHVNLEAYGRELGALQKWERWEDEDE